MRIGIDRLRTALKAFADFSDEINPEWLPILKQTATLLSDYYQLAYINTQIEPELQACGAPSVDWTTDIENIKITGLENAVYTDKFDNFNRNIEKNAITFKGAFDRVYSNTSNDCYIEDEKFNRVITIKKSNSNSTVIWTPGKDNAIEMGDMGEKDEWRRMVCVETANTLENSIVVYPQLSHSIATEYSVHDY